MRRQYKYNHRTDNNQFERKDLITRLGNNRASSWSPTYGKVNAMDDNFEAERRAHRNAHDGDDSFEKSCDEERDAAESAVREARPTHLLQ
jgi:hypothetical protein